MPRAQEIRRMFGRITGRYDLLNRVLSLGLDTRWRARLVQTLNECRPAGCALDLASGTGDVACALLEGALGLECIVALDFSLPMCRASRLKLGASSSRGRTWFSVCADCLRLPFPDNYFNTVTVAFGVRNFESLEQGVGEIFRVTKPGGQIAILEFAPPESALLRLLYLPYLKVVLPLLGRFLARDPLAYGYLSSSIQSFLNPRAMCDALLASGFKTAKAEKLTHGITCLYTARR